MNTTDISSVPDRGLPLRSGLWLAQILLAGLYIPTAIAVLFLPASELPVAVPWAAHVPENVLKFIGTLDLAAGLGVVLPSLTRLAPRLTVLAGACSALLQAFVILSHALLGTPAVLAVNVAVLTLSAFVAWGRSDKEPIAPRRRDRNSVLLDMLAMDQAAKPAARPRRYDMQTRSHVATALPSNRNQPRGWATSTNRRSSRVRTCRTGSGNRLSR